MANVDPARHGVIEASAGTGKTYTLTRHALRLIGDGLATLGQILLVTYTEKATGELKERLREALEKELVEKPDKSRLFRPALDDFDQAPVYTIHGFCQQVLQDYAFENRHDFNPQLVYDKTLLGPCLREIQRRDWRREFGDGLAGILELSDYDGEKWEGQALDLALRFRPACAHQLHPEPTADLVAELRRLDEELGRDWKKMCALAGNPAPTGLDTHIWFQGFGDLDYRADYREPRRLKILWPLLQSLADAGSRRSPLTAHVQLLGKCRSLSSFKDHGFSLLTDRLDKKALAQLPSVCPGLREAVALLEERRQKVPSENLQQQLTVHTIHNLQRHLAAHKRERGLQSFEDMLTRVDEALANPHTSDSLLEQLRKRYRYAVVDEFQDTDLLQWRIFRRIFVDGAGPNRLVVVGDPKQAIFGFRGADLATYLKATAELRRLPGASPDTLDVNWRSSPEMLAALNQLFEGGGWFANTDISYRRVQAPEAKDDRPWRAEDDNTDRAAFNLVNLTGLDTLTAARRAMGRFIAAEVQRLLRPGSGLLVVKKGEAPRPLHAGDFCVLVQRRAEAAPVIDALRDASIPYTFAKQTGLWQSPEAIHLGYVLRAISRPTDTAAFKKALLTRFFRVQPEALATCEEVPAEHDARHRFRTWCDLAQKRRWAVLFQSLLEESGILFDPDDPEQADRRQANYRYIGQTLAETAYQRDLDLLGVIDELEQRRRGSEDEESGVQPIETERAKVKFMTIHAAKGLEFPIVFLAGGYTSGRASAVKMYRDNAQNLVFDLCPDAAAEARSKQEREAEDRRLYYVALTRPMFKLYVPYVRLEKTPRSPGPLISLLGPAVEQAKLAELGDKMVRVIEPDLAVPKSLAPTKPKGGKTSPDVLSLPGALIPELDSKLSERRIFTRSFTSLHRAAQRAEQPRYTERLPRADDDAVDGLEDAPTLRGPIFGEMLHEIMEAVDFAHVGRTAGPTELPADVHVLIAETCRRHWPRLAARFATEERFNGCCAELARLTWAALRTPLAALGGPLWQIPACDRLHELEFHFPQVDGAPPPEIQAAEGFLTGSIDLVIRVSKRLFLLDWKTNWLPGYGPTEIAQCMKDSDYHRQYRLYLQALERWRRQMKDSTSTEFGGVYYLFVRGMNGTDESAGVSFHRPETADFDLARVLDVAGGTP